MTRLPNWPFLLDHFLTANREHSFGYGSWDCCLFVCDAVAIMTGIDPAAPFRGRYSTRKGARRAMAEYCGVASVARVAELVAAGNGMPEIPPLFAGRGDVVLVKRSLGLVGLTGREVLIPGPQGLTGTTITNAVKAWRV